MKIYIAGPMRGHKYYNFPAFDNAREKLCGDGFQPVSPANMDRGLGFDETDFPADHDWNTWPDSLGSMKDVIIRDVETILRCDGIYMLDGWEQSKGAFAEHALARWAGKETLYERTSPIKALPLDPLDEDILEEALRITGGDRQNSYGPPDQDFKRTAIMWEQLLAPCINANLKGYIDLKIEPRHIALCMIALKLSRETHQKKRDNLVDIAGYARCASLCK